MSIPTNKSSVLCVTENDEISSVSREQRRNIKRTDKRLFCLLSKAMKTQVLQKKLSTTMGERDSLWDVVVKWDDICFKHILPRLNRTDVKFLGEVNSETRKLIKRSSRASDFF